MSDLSPSAQAVYDAFNRIGLYNEPSFETDRKALAAALRAAADQVVPDTEYESYEVLMIAMSVRHKLLAIAAELENQ
jgi:hypothetical protein